MTTVSDPTGRLRLKSLTIRGLLGRRPFRMELAKDGVTLLTGSNGTGKSTILRSVYATANGRWHDLHRLPFHRLSFSFDRGPKLDVTRDEADDLIVTYGEQTPWVFSPHDLVLTDLDELPPSRMRAVRRISPMRYEFEGKEYRKRDLEYMLALRDLVARSDAQWVSDIPNWFSVRFITDQRLIIQPDRAHAATPSRTLRSIPVRSAVDELSRELSMELSRELADYAAQSQNFDRLFPQRVIEAMSSNVVPPLPKVRSLLEQLASDRKALERVGLLEGHLESLTSDDPRLEDEGIRQVISTFANDTLAKFATLADLQRRLELFLDFLNAHYERKHVFVDRTAGLVIRTDDGMRVRASDLSSGEQQILVLAYQVLFETQPRSLILIDEPELSLHVLWQATLVDDLAQMGSARDASFVLATHSPSLIGDRDELVRSLDR